MNRKLIIGGGGTGGHVFPAISIANALKSIDPDIDILFVGAKGKLEMEKIPEAGYSVIGLPVTGFPRKISIKSLTFFYSLLISMIKARKIIKSFRPDVVIGVGGYASGPIVKAASRSGIPVVLQEQNSYAGITNRLLASRAQKVFVAYEGMGKYFPSEKIIFAGNPVRKDIINSSQKREKGLKHFGLKEKYPVVLVLGGSLGAGSINNAVKKNIGMICVDIQLIWQSGKIYFPECSEALKGSERKNVVLLEFIKEMDLAYACADIIISRAGAGTISELALTGKPVILIPSPNVAEDHQSRNAMALVEKNAAIMIKDSEAENKLADTINDLVQDEERRKILSRNIEKLAIPDAAERIAEEILKLFKK